MNKKEKIIAIIFIISFILVISSALYTIYQLKPADYSFAIERWFLNIFNK